VAVPDPSEAISERRLAPEVFRQAGRDGDVPRRNLNVAISAEAYSGWSDYCGLVGTSMTAMIQAVGEVMAYWVSVEAPPDADGSEIIRRARLIDAQRRRKR
jgi:hypothetical protein